MRGWAAVFLSRCRRRTRAKAAWALLALLAAGLSAGSARAQMDPYFTAVNYTAPKDNLMLMLLPDYQLARTGPDFLTFMGMAEYGVTDRWTAGFMAEGQKIPGLPVTFGGIRINSYYRFFRRDRPLQLALYGEFEDLNGAALYKMEVSGFGGEDLPGNLRNARQTPAHTFEQRAIIYRDWGRTNLTFNFVNETGLEDHENDFGYAWGVFRQPVWSGMDVRPGMNMNSTRAGVAAAPPLLSGERVGYGVEMIGALGNSDQFGFDWPRQQQYLGPVFSYALTQKWSFRLEPAFGLSDVSDRFVLRVGLSYSLDHLGRRLRRAF